MFIRIPKNHSLVFVVNLLFRVQFQDRVSNEIFEFGDHFSGNKYRNISAIGKSRTLFCFCKQRGNSSRAFSTDSSCSRCPFRGLKGRNRHGGVCKENILSEDGYQNIRKQVLFSQWTRTRRRQERGMRNSIRGEKEAEKLE